MLEKLCPANSSTEHLFVGTDRYMYFTVSWDSQARQLRTEKSYQDHADKTARDSQTEDRCLVDPTRRFFALLLYDGIVTILPIHQQGKKKSIGEPGTLGDPVPARISDLSVRSSTFLYPRQGSAEQLKLAFLYEDNQQKVCLTVRKVEYAAGVSGEPGSADLDRVVAVRDDLELGASHLIAVPAPACMPCPVLAVVHKLTDRQMGCSSLLKLQLHILMTSMEKFWTIHLRKQRNLWLGQRLTISDGSLQMTLGNSTSLCFYWRMRATSQVGSLI